MDSGSVEGRQADGALGRLRLRKCISLSSITLYGSLVFSGENLALPSPIEAQ